MNLPQPPDGSSPQTDPRAWTDWARKLNGVIEQEFAAISQPAKATVVISNPPSPEVTTFDASAATLGDTRNFVASVFASMIRRGMLRSKAGDV